MPNRTPPSPQTFVKTITLIHTALITGQLLFAILALVHAKKYDLGLPGTKDPFAIVVPVVAIAAFIAGNFMFTRQLANVPATGLLKDKLSVYQSALIMQFAFLEGASLLGITVFFITGKLLYLFISGLLIAYNIWLRPTQQRTTDELKLSYQEQLEMKGADSIH